MEATIERGITYTYNHSELNNIINNTIDKIKKYVKDNDYQVIIGEIRNYDFDFSKLSKNQMKKLQKYCYWIDKKPTLKRVNTFFSLLSRYFGTDRVRIKISLKEEKIQSLRKEWLSARYTAENALARYKVEKGDFYKKKLLMNK